MHQTNPLMNHIAAAGLALSVAMNVAWADSEKKHGDHHHHDEEHSDHHQDEKKSKKDHSHKHKHHDDDHDHGHKRHAGAHVHGEGELEFTHAGNAIRLSVELPLKNLVGTEERPKNDAERKERQALLEKLAQPGTIVDLPSEAGCQLKRNTLEIEYSGKKGHETHAELEGSLEYSCSSLKAGQTVTVNLMKTYPSFEEIEVEYVTNGKQGKAQARKAGNETPKFSLQ